MLLLCVNICCFDLLQTMTSMKPPACRFSLKVPHLLAWPSDLTFHEEALVQYELKGRANSREQRGASDSAKALGKRILTEETAHHTKPNHQTAVSEKDWKWTYYRNCSVCINSFENTTYTTKILLSEIKQAFCLIMSFLYDNQAIY